MKLSTIAAALLLSKEAYAAQEVGRMRKVKIYSSSTLLRNVEFGRGVVDPYIGLADEREQRGLEEQLPTPTIGSMSTTLDMSMPAQLSMPTIGSMSTNLEMSMPATSSNDKSFSLEMSMPATGLTDQSFSLELSMSATSLTDQSVPHVPVQGGANDLMAKAEKSDPYIGLPDERKQRGFVEQLSMPTIGSMSTNLEMSMPATSSNDNFSLEMSMPATGLTDQSFSLELSMSATSLTDQSVPHVPVQGGANAVMAKAEKRENRAMTMGNVEFGTDVVDPYIGLPDERKQRGLEELSMPTIGSMSTTLEMSMPVTSLTDQSFSLEMSMPATGSNDKSFSLEMSMPTTGLTDQSFSYPPVQGGAIGSMSTTTLEISMPETSLTDQSAPYLPVQGATADMMATAEITENSAMTTGHSSVAAVATFVSAVAGVVALV